MLKEFKNRMHWAWEETYYRGNINALDEIYAPDVVIHAPPYPDAKGVDSYKHHAAEALQLYSNIRYDWEETTVEGNTIVDRFTMHMKHTGQIQTLPVPPTGREISVKCCRVAHLKDGKIIEEFNNDIFNELVG